MKWVIAGGTGFIGSALTQHLVHLGHQVVVLSRKHRENKEGIVYVKWNPARPESAQPYLEDAHVLVNLCGQSVDTRYTEENKQQLYDSRLIPTRTLGRAVNACSNPPKVCFQMSTATIYADRIQGSWDEQGELGKGFSVDLARKWEAEARRSFKGIERLIFMRTSIVLGRGGGAYLPYRQLARMGCRGFGGRSLMFSWMHVTDFCRAVVHLEHNTNFSGIVNMAAQPTEVRTFMQLIALQHGVSPIANMPEWMIHLGALIVRTEPELLLKSRSMQPGILREINFKFLYQHIEDAVYQLERENVQATPIQKKSSKTDYLSA